MTVPHPDFGHKTASFLNWFKALPGATFHPDIEIRDFRDRAAGRGIVATADIPQDTVLFTIPRAAIINTQTSDLAKKIPDLFATTGLDDADNEADDDGDETSGPPDNWISLILVMIYEYLKGDSSKWHPYFSVLPTEFETLIWWSSHELEQLQASSIIPKIGKDEADAMFRVKVLPVVERYPDVFYPAGSHKLADSDLMLLAHRMGSIIMAYAFDLEGDDEDAEREEGDEWVEDKEGKILMGMVPMADILNADAQFNAHVNHEEDSLSVTAIKPIRTGEEILNYYGPLGNGELLRRYGYVTDHHARYDVIELSWESVLQALKATLDIDESIWERAATELDPEEIEDAFVLDRDLDEPNAEGDFAGDDRTLKHLPEDLKEQINAVLRSVRKLSPSTIPDKEKRDEICHRTMRRAFEHKLAEYPTTAEDDQRLISEAPRYSRSRMAAVVRRGEKVLLREAIDFANDRINELEALAEDGGRQPSAKRPRTK